MRCRIAIAVLLLTLAPASHAALEFSGYFSAGGEARFVVTDLATGKLSRWLALGETFEGHKLIGFDPPTETLSIEYDGATLRLALRPSRVKVQQPTEARVTDLQLAVDADGGLSLDGRPIPLEQMAVILRNSARNGRPIAISVQHPPHANARVKETDKAVLELIQRSELKKYVVRIIDGN